MLTGASAIFIAVLTFAALGLRPGWIPPWGAIPIGVAAFVLPFIILARYKGRAGTADGRTDGIVRDFDWLRSNRLPLWVLKRARCGRRPKDDLPDIAVIGLAAMNWASLFDEQNTAATKAVLRVRKGLRLGIAMARHDDRAVSFMARATDPTIPEGTIKRTLDVLCARLDADFGEFRDRVEVRLLPNAVPDSMCAYDPCLSGCFPTSHARRCRLAAVEPGGRRLVWLKARPVEAWSRGRRLWQGQRSSVPSFPTHGRRSGQQRGVA